MWPGGKDGAGVAQRLINEIPPHDVFVSAFLGDCAIMRRKRPAALNIGIDLDRENVERWSRSAPSPFDAALELYCCDAIEWLRYRFGWYRVDGNRGPDRDAVNSDGARSWLDGATTSTASLDRATAAAGVAKTFVYADPPYLVGTRRRKERLYRHEMTDEQHVELLATLKTLPCLVMVSHYPCQLYDGELAGWRSFTFSAQTRGGARAIEKVWCNYPAPVVLHDARYLGRTKREREKIRRRRRTLERRLKRLPPLERQALLATIT